ncbi:MAG TPA: ABC transporter ATP-binding protein, partial [Candidatus Avipropionibacterium avicola]|nr:ABC transporter ATP-binding protein [Candidatus Avipropionibacterium avicola]
MSLDSAAVVEKSTLPVAGSRATARVAWRLLWARPALLVVVVIASLCAGAAGLVAPIVLGRLVDVLPTTAGLDWSAQFRPVAIAAGLTVAAGLVGAVFTWIGMRATAQVGEHAVADLREKVVGRALQLDAAQVERAGTGDLVSRVAEDSRTVAAATSQLVPYLLSALTAVVTTSVGMVALDWRLGLVG